MRISSDQEAMALALAAAERALWLSNPNPRVGCILTTPDGEVLGQGHTQAVGQAHAEIMALRDAAANGRDVRGATAYVTLEPCAHHGRTPPCVDALIDAQVSRVVIAATDPNPAVNGSGIARLRAAGIDVTQGLMADAARGMNIGFFSRMIRKTPWVRLKMAASADGITALPNGESQWITSPEARADGHRFRAQACAVLTGAGTVLADDPHLGVHEVPTARQPHVVVVDSRLQTPVNARLLTGDREKWLYHSGVADEATCDALKQTGATLIALANAHQKVDLATMLTDLAARGVNEVHLEAGTALNGSFLRENLVDELLLYVAPTLLGQGQGLSNFGPLTALADGRAMRWLPPTMVGPDLRLRAVIGDRDTF
ncbi:MAG: bifunctional diaminohydroxyphosphoribosylaminopyrimidine deaminase/5-amino-6-(5-phosphoribosylamino)uracil reductase RibD [Burkholderiaceae bacterium]